MTAVQKFPLNPAGRDFVVGDIHGAFSGLETALAEVKFDEARDRLFSVGDLVDRGPESDQALTWWPRTWFHACRGNHEQMLLDANANPLHWPSWRENGGGWWLGVLESQREAFVDVCEQLPFAIEIETASGPVGVVHADLPGGLTWDDMLHALEQGDRRVAMTVLWSRAHVWSDAPVPDPGPRIHHVYCGHTVTQDPVTRGKLSWIDTGACFGKEILPSSRFTVVEIHPRHDPPPG